MFEYKVNPKNNDFIYNVLKGEDGILLYVLMLFQKVNDINKIISLQHYKSYIRQDIDLNYQELQFYDEFQWVIDQKVVEVHKAYLLIKAAILHDQVSYFYLSWNMFSSNDQKEYFFKKQFVM